MSIYRNMKYSAIVAIEWNFGVLQKYTTKVKPILCKQRCVRIHLVKANPMTTFVK